MPAKHALNVSLTEQLRDFVEEQVRSGRFQTASEVVRSALRLLQDDRRGSVGEHGQGAGKDLASKKLEQPLAHARQVEP
jgi:Arc/MetJ-type ribon-helix-helix transcriptional regulator